jgi:hypothetical protein
MCFAIPAILGAVSSIAGGAAANASAKAQAAAMNQNARIAERQSSDAHIRGGLEELAIKRRMSVLNGAQRAQAAASGVDVNSGSMLDVQNASTREGSMDVALNEMNHAREAWGYDVQASNYRNQASVARAEGRNAFTAGLIGGGASLLSLATPGAGTGGAAGGAGTIKPKSWYDEKQLGRGGYAF